MNDIVYAGKHSVTYKVPRHEHDTWELIYCTGQSGELRFDDLALSYGIGTVAVIPPHTPHSNVSQDGFTNIHVNLADATLNFRQPVLIQDDGNRSLRGVFSGIFFQFYETSEQRESILAAYGNLLVTYLLAYQKASPLSKIVQEIASHIVRHYSDPAYALDDYLKSLPYNYDYLRKLFQKELGMTPHKFLNDRRLQTAASMLCSQYNDGNVTEVAHLCGFREPLYFSRMFKKKYGLSPSFYYASRQRGEPERPKGPNSMKIMLPDETERPPYST